MKKKKFKRWLVFLALAVVVGTMALNFLAYRHAYAMMHFTTGKPRCPILFLHGTADPRAHIEEARRVFAAVSAPKRFKEFTAAGHEASVVRFPAEWNETVGQFLAEVENHTVQRTGASRFPRDEIQTPSAAASRR